MHRADAESKFRESEKLREEGELDHDLIRDSRRLSIPIDLRVREGRINDHLKRRVKGKEGTKPRDESRPDERALVDLHTGGEGRARLIKYLTLT